jgi:hypothetical protein
LNILLYLISDIYRVIKNTKENQKFTLDGWGDEMLTYDSPRIWDELVKNFKLFYILDKIICFLFCIIFGTAYILFVLLPIIIFILILMKHYKLLGF